MKFEFMDQNVSLTMNVFLIIANIINLIYNIPQVVKTYQLKSTKEFSSWFLFLRIIGNAIWIGYAIEVDSFLMLLNNIVTVIASMFIGYYKVIEIYNNYKKNHYRSITNNHPDLEDSNNIIASFDNVTLTHYQNNNNVIVIHNQNKIGDEFETIDIL